jgi:hypothetical protein
VLVIFQNFSMEGCTGLWSGGGERQLEEVIVFENKK